MLYASNAIINMKSKNKYARNTLKDQTWLSIPKVIHQKEKEDQT